MPPHPFIDDMAGVDSEDEDEEEGGGDLIDTNKDDVSVCEEDDYLVDYGKIHRDLQCAA